MCPIKTWQLRRLLLLVCFWQNWDKLPAAMVAVPVRCALRFVTIGSIWTWIFAPATNAAVPSVTFETPSLVGESNSSAPGGSSFWFPSISIPTGIKGHVAQHVTLSGDGGGGCQYEGQKNQACEQIMLTSDGGLTYDLIKKVRDGTSGNFNGYNDLGTWVPPKAGYNTTPGKLSAYWYGLW